MPKIIFIILIFAYSNLALANPVVAQHGMVVTDQVLASEVGINILKAGGNAVDAAVAVGYALAVVNPCCGNIGGSGFMLIHLANGKNIFINFRSRAPLAATADMFLDKGGKVIPGKSLFTYSAVAVPGTVLGLETALKNYGTLTRQQVMQPAIHLAAQGFVLTSGDVNLILKEGSHFKDSANVTAIFFPHNQPLKAGDKLIQMDLANTLKLISAQGPAAFYQGPIAKKIVAASQANQGILSLKDFADYRVEILNPIKCSYHGYTIVSAPPPSSGGTTLCEMLNILEPYPLSTWGFHSKDSIHYITEAERVAFYDRNKIGDPDFITNPIDHLISKKYAATIRQHIQKSIATPSSNLGTVQTRKEEDINTTHYSIVDKFGNAVAVTYTLNSYFGTQLMAGDTGFFLNNDMDDFTAKVGVPNQFGLILGANNKIAPGKRPLSAMSPTIILKDKKIVMVVGSPGGPRIITSVLQTILNVFAYKMDIQTAVDAPRFHHQWLPDVIDIEANSVTPAIKEQLIKMGYHFSVEPPWSSVEAIYMDPLTQKLYGGSDHRRPTGKAVGY